MVETKTEQANGDNLDIKVGDKINIGTPEQEPSPQRKPKKGPDKGGFYWGTGRRKSSVARVRIKQGEGTVAINKSRKINDYFVHTRDRKAVTAPLKAVDMLDKMDVFINVKGGGTTGQAGACVLGIARALTEYNEEFTEKLREGGYLTRDSRMVERKKPGRPKARKSFQFSKR
jgi:small subunit ribosomal protein S9